MKIIRRITTGALLVSATVAGKTSAQIGNPWQVELGAFGTFTRYDKTDTGLAAKLGAGGRLGLYVSRRFSIEVHGDYTATEEADRARDVQVTRADGTLFLHTPGNTYVGLGYGRSHYSGAGEGTDWGPHVILGIRLPLGGRAAFRLDGRLDYLPSAALSPTESAAVNIGAAVGISIFAFGGPARDQDGDGVPDKTDQCPNTPIGATVDDQGCPLDGDGDGVYDGLDLCPDTPAGAFVGADGCPSDTDADGVFDGVDVCPNTPAGAVVDANGCPIDSDDDGVFDGLDQCPDTPRGATVNASGCPSDSDGDGVLDGLDQCPNTPPDTEVDERGCTVERDSDGDGVLDGVDRCPNTAAGQEVDAVGCPTLFQVEQGIARPLVLTGVAFETGRSALTQDSYMVLDRVAESLLENPYVRVEIAGHTDNTGSDALNRRLSLERAQAVKAYLARKGIDPSRMEARGYGPDEPIATNATAAGRAQNRRVELRQLDQPGQ